MFNMKKLISLALVVCIFATFSGFAKAGSTKVNGATTYPIKVTDADKKVVTIEKEPTRVVSISPTITETIFALGKGSKLVGRTDYCDYPSEASKVSSVGQMTNPSLEKIVALRPDLVIVTEMMNKDTVKKLKELNIKVLLMYNQESFNGVYTTISTLGNILNANDKAKNIITGMKYRVSLVTEKTKNVKRPSVYYVVGYGKYGDFTATGDTFISNMIEMAGGTNAAKDGKQWQYSIEKLVQKNPDIMICTKFFDTKKGISTTTGYKDLKAVKNGKLLEIDENLISRQGPRLAEGLYKLAKLIHPELFK